MVAESNKKSSLRIADDAATQRVPSRETRRAERAADAPATLQLHSNLIAGHWLHSSDPRVDMARVHPLVQHSDPNTDGVDPVAIFLCLIVGYHFYVLRYTFFLYLCLAVIKILNRFISTESAPAVHPWRFQGFHFDTTSVHYLRNGPAFL